MWHYSDGTNTHGPIDEAALREMLLRGTVNRNTLIWREGMSEWESYGSIFEPSNNRVVLSRVVIFGVLFFVFMLFFISQSGKFLGNFMNSGSSSVVCPKCKATVSVKNDKCYKCGQVKLSIKLGSGGFRTYCSNCENSSSQRCGKCDFGDW